MGFACSIASLPTISKADGKARVQVDFYHLTRAPVDQVLPRIAERVTEGGGRLLVVTADADLAERLDRLLWTYAPDSFLAHGRAGDAQEAAQPILIAGTADAANGARNIAIVDGTWRDEALAFERAFHFFDEDHIVAARAAWRELKGREGVDPRYWRQNDDGRWEKMA